MWTRNVALVMIGVLSGMVAWLFTTWYVHKAPEPVPAVVTVFEEQLDPETALRGSIEGTISDGGEPIAHARVCANARSPRVLALEPMPRCTQTDATGRYAIGALLAGAYRVVAMAPAYRPAAGRDLTVMPNERRQQIDMTLVSGGVALTGVVSGTDGKPVAGVLVHEQDAGAAVETDADGRFTLWVAPGDAAVVAIGHGFAFADAGARAPGAVRITLSPESSIEGIAIDAATRLPIARADVVITGDEEPLHALTDAKGRFFVGQLRRGRYVARATTPHAFGETAGSVAVGLAEPVRDVVVAMHPAYRVAGRILVGDRVCDRGAVMLDDGTHRHTSWRAGDGSVHLDGVRPGTYGANVTCDGAVPRRYGDVVVAGDVGPLEWRMDPGAAIAGHVRATSGAPIAGADVSVRIRDAIVRARTAADGSYALRGLPDGEHVVEVATSEALPNSFTIQIADVRREHDLVLDAGGEIAGRVVTRSGIPVENAVVLAAMRGNSPWVARVRSDAAGTFRFAGVPPGHVRVETGTAGEWTRVDADRSSTVELAIDPITRSITGLVLDDEQRPIANALVIATPESNDTLAIDPVLARAGADGAFELFDLPAGAFTLRALREGGGEGLLEHVEAGTTAALHVARPASIEGVVAGEPEELRVIVRGDRGERYDERFSHTAGAWAVQGLAPGHYQLVVEASDREQLVDVTLAPAEQRRGLEVMLSEPRHGRRTWRELQIAQATAWPRPGPGRTDP